MSQYRNRKDDFIYHLDSFVLLRHTYTAQPLQPVSEGQIIDMGAYSVRAPLGEGWEAEINKERGTINFIKAKKRALGILGGGTVIKVFVNAILSPKRWHLSEEEV